MIQTLYGRQIGQVASHFDLDLLTTEAVVVARTSSLKNCARWNLQPKGSRHVFEANSQEHAQDAEAMRVEVRARWVPRAHPVALKRVPTWCAI